MNKSTNQTDPNGLFEEFYAYKPLIAKLIINSGVCKRTPHEVNDMLQSIYCKLWLNIAQYNPDKASVQVYLMKIAFSVINNTYKEFNTQKRREELHNISLSSPVMPLDEDATFEEIIPDENDIDPIQKVEEKDLVDRMLEVLSPNEKLIIEQHFFEGKPMYVIGEEIGKTRQRVHQIITHACTKIAQNEACVCV